MLLSEPRLKTDYLLREEVVGESRVNLMGQAERRQQLPAAVTEGTLHERVAFITARELFPFVVRGIWEECRSQRTGLFKITSCKRPPGAGEDV